MDKHNLTPAEIRGIAPVAELDVNAGRTPEEAGTSHDADADQLSPAEVISILSAATRNISEEEALEDSIRRHPSAAIFPDKPAS